MNVSNLFSTVPVGGADEAVEDIVSTGGVKIERIVSHGHASPEGFWYDQESTEWVVVLRGSAGVRFEGEPEVRAMGVGDHLVIPAHVRHRVEWTDPHEPTVWLAVHY